MNSTIRLLFLGTALLFLIVGAAFFLQIEWATANLVPWQEGRLTNIFYASIFIAIACPVFWVVYADDPGAAAGGTLNLSVTTGGVTLFFLQEFLSGDEDGILVYAIATALIFIINVGFFLWTQRLPLRDTRPMPMPVKVSFVIFIILLILVGGALVLKTPDIFPWAFRNIETSVVVGWIFLGASVYFMYALARPMWHNAAGQLVGFLSYDLVLIVPFLNHFNAVPDNLLDSLVVYTAVVIYSGALAIYFLFVHPATRLRMPGRHDPAVAAT